MSKGRHLTPRRRRLSRGWALPLSLSLVMLMTGLAWADNLVNDVEADANDNKIVTITQGDATGATVNFRIVANSGDDQKGCNAEDDTPASVTISVAAPAIGSITRTPSTPLLFSQCDVAQGVKFTASVDAIPGDYAVTGSVNDDGTGTYNTRPTAFTLRVIADASADVTAPTITITTPADGAVYLLHEVVYADYECEDEPGGSDVSSCEGTVDNGDPIDTATVGTKTFTVNAEDNAGNTAIPLTHNYSVVYDFAGFFQPVENPGPDADVWNKAKAGQGIPVKFSLDGDQGLDIFKTGSPTAAQVACPSGTGTTYDTIETTTANSSGLIYDADAGQYIYVWKTNKTFDGKCYKFKLGLNDDSSWYALFDFRK